MYGVNVSYAKALTSLKVLILPKKNDFDLRFSGLLKNYTADLLSFSLFEKSTKFPIRDCIKNVSKEQYHLVSTCDFLLGCYGTNILHLYLYTVINCIMLMYFLLTTSYVHYKQKSLLQCYDKISMKSVKTLLDKKYIKIIWSKYHRINYHIDDLCHNINDFNLISYSTFILIVVICLCAKIVQNNRILDLQNRNYLLKFESSQIFRPSLIIKSETTAFNHIEPFYGFRLINNHLICTESLFLTFYNITLKL
ncbi:hypothetical protein BLOT_002397 [Blomia tropicalis]|nr:hypothetical protein BLOT_002397 [Blomia tropicalis]